MKLSKGLEMKTREYHIQEMILNRETVYRVVITYGLMDTKTIGPFTTVKAARQYCKDDALATEVKPLIIK